MTYPPFAGNDFFAAFAKLMLETGTVDRNTPLTTETLDVALSAYIINVIEEHNYRTGGTYDA